MKKKKMIPVKEVVRDMLAEDAEFKAEYERLEPHYAFLEAMVRVQMKLHLSQEELAERMKTSQTAISRLFSGKQAPTWNTIMKFATATNTRPVITFVSAR